nr:hypothetical protein [Tanacetum cinerariifolium]
MGINEIAKVARGWFLGCDLSLDCRGGGEDNEQCRDTVHFFARLSEGYWNLLCIRHEYEKTRWPIMVRHESEKTAWRIVIVRFPSIYRLRISWIPIGIVVAVLKLVPFRFTSFVKSKGALDFYGRMRELVMKYKAEKICHEEMFKMPLVDLKVFEDGSYRICIDYRKLSEIAIRNRCHQMRVHEEEIPKTNFRRRYGHFVFTVMPFGLTKAPVVFMKSHKVKGGVRVTLEDKFGAVEEREVLCEAQQGRSRVQRKLFGSFRNKIEELNMRQRRWMALFSDYGCQTKYHMGKANIVVNAWRRKGGMDRIWILMVGDVRTLIMKEAHATKYSVHPGDEIGESKMIGLEMEQETTKVVMINERLKEAKDSVVHFGKKGELAPRYVGPLEILETIGPSVYFSKRLASRDFESKKMAWPIVVRHESEKTAWPIIVRHAYVKMAWPSVRPEWT